MIGKKEKKRTSGYNKTAGGAGGLLQKIREIYSRNRELIKHNVEGMPRPVSKGIIYATMIVEAITIILLLILNLLPLKFLLLILFVMLAIDAGILALVLNRKGRKKRAYAGMIISMLIIIMLVPASFFLYTTGDALQKISSMRDQWEDYHVIAMKDSAYENIDDIRGETVYGIKNINKMNEEANERLITAASVKIEEEGDILSQAEKIQDQTGQLNDNLIFTSKTYYEMQCEEIEGFGKNTKVIYTMQVMKKSDRHSQKVNVTEDPFNVYITGLDTWGSIDRVSRSDVNMIVTINPQTKQILLTSIPRDAYVELHSFGQMDKLTHSGIFGVEETIDTVQDWLDIDIEYYVKVNFSMLVRLIDAVGNIDVYSDEEFDSAISYYHYKKGWNTLHGKQALYFARERKSFEKGDAKRIKNQQKVVEALIKKVTSSRVLLTRYPEILEAISENMTTNMSRKDISKLVRMQLRDMDNKWEIKTTNVECTEASMGTYSMGMGRKLYVNIPKEESVEKVKEQIHNVMYPAQAVEKPEEILP